MLATPALASISPRIYYVDSNRGDDRAEGTDARPVRTITAAMRKPLRGGDTVIVRDGTYRECVHVGKGGAPGWPITIRSETLGGAIIDASRLAGIPLHIAAPFVEVWGFEVIGNRHKAGIVVAETHHVGVRNTTVHGAGGSGIYARLSDWLAFVGCEVYDCASHSAGSAISVHIPVELADGTGTRVLIRSNRLHDCVMKTDPAVTPHTDGHGIILDDWERWRTGGTPYRHAALVERNTSWGNGGDGILNFRNRAPHMIRDNVCWGNGTDAMPGGLYGAELGNRFSEGATYLRNIAVANQRRHSAAACLDGSAVWIGNTLHASGPGSRVWASDGAGLPAGNITRDPGFIDPPRDFRRRA